MSNIISGQSSSQKQSEDYTQGSIIGSILKMGIPAMLGFLTQNIYTLVDMWWVSRLPQSESAVAGITFFGAILMFLFSFNQLVGPGSVAVISRRYGEKNYDMAEKGIKETLLLKLIFGFFFGLLGFIFSEKLLYMIGARGEALELALEYSSIMFLTLALPYTTYSIFTAMRAVGNPRMSMLLMVSSNLLNMGLDPVLMFGWFGFPAMGIRGAAVASAISFGLTLVVGVAMMYFGKANVRLHLSGHKPVSLSSMLTLIKIGLPSWVGSLSFSGARLLLSPIIATFGTSVMAAFGVGMQITGFGVMIVVGIGLGLSTLIGHNVGSAKLERARQTGNLAIYLVIGGMIVYGVVCFLFARPIVALFFDSTETIAYGTVLLKTLSFSLPALGLFIIIETIHIGVGLNTPIMVFQMAHSWLLQLLPVYVGVTFFNIGPEVVWWIITFSLLISSSGVFLYYRRGKWLTTKV